MELGAPDFALLPAHIVTDILRLLEINDFKNAITVCKSWHYASTDPQIERTLTLRPKEEHFSLVCKSNRKYGGLSLQMFKFDKVDSYYFELFEKFCPFICKLRLFASDLKIHHLLKLLELSTYLIEISIYQCSQLEWLPGLFPSNYDDVLKTRIVTNLSGIIKMDFMKVRSIPMIAVLVLFAKNLEKLEYSIPYYGNTFKDFFTILDNCNMQNLKHLYLNLQLCGYVEQFLMGFVKIENVNLKSFNIYLRSRWNEAPNSYLFHQFILKLESLEEFSVSKFGHGHLSIICQNLVNLKSLDCHQLNNDQPISQICNLKQLEKLHYAVPRNYYENYKVESVIEIDKLFACKFEYLRVLYFEEFVTATNLERLCKNHPNLNELKLTCLLTRNFEAIFQHLTKLRILHIYFGFEWLRRRIHPFQDVPLVVDHKKLNYEYKLLRLQDLEEFNLSELVPGIQEDEVWQMEKLKSTNLLELFVRQTQLNEQIILKENEYIFQQGKSVQKTCNIL